MTDKETPLGKMNFDIGWKLKKDIIFNDATYEIVVKCKAYKAEDGITTEQEAALKKFAREGEKQLAIAAQMLNGKFPDAGRRFVPTMLLFNRDGEYALLLDDKDNPDEGMCAILSPRREIVSQDEYL